MYPLAPLHDRLVVVALSSRLICAGPQHRVQATERERGERGAERDVCRPLAEPPSCAAQVYVPQGTRTPVGGRQKRVERVESCDGNSIAVRFEGCFCSFLRVCVCVCVYFARFVHVVQNECGVWCARCWSTQNGGCSIYLRLQLTARRAHETLQYQTHPYSFQPTLPSSSL